MRLRPLVHWIRRALRRRDAVRTRRSPRVPKPPWRPRPIRSWVLLAVFGLILIGGWCYYELQMAEIESVRTSGDAQADLEIAKMRLDTVRATLTVAAGIGAASALVLSFRRQQHDEFHSTQQRITELRMQAVEQLSSSDHTIRRSGLYNLERLGEQHEELRQLVLDEICSYLRRPFDAEATSDFDPEREVRAFAMEILERRLKRKLGPRNYWNHSRLDLEAAVLTNIDFSDCLLRNADFSGVRFRGASTFHRAVFEGRTWFDKAVFEGAAMFPRAVFGGQAVFDEAVFRSGADFSRARFSRPTTFKQTRFDEDLDCTLADFQHFDFTEALVEGGANFGGAVFHGYTDFSQSAFKRWADFELASFEDDVFFSEVEFGGVVDFTDVCFGWANFERTTFQYVAVFDQAIFRGHTLFREVVCVEGASFRGAQFYKAVAFDRSAFLGDVLMSGALFRSLLCDQALPGNYRPVEPRGGGILRYWTARAPDGSEPSAPHLAFGELGL
jgi:uncharacterized protein YjbI with pentapeptide repeats